MEGKDTRRRLVQSTLFPQLGSPNTAAENRDDNSEEVGVEEEEWCDSSKKRGGSRRKVNSKSRTPPSASSKKVMKNGVQRSINQLNDSDSLLIAKSSFFTKASKAELQRSCQNELVDSAEENGEICSQTNSIANGTSTPPTPNMDNATPRKGKRSSTPRKESSSSTPTKRMKNGKKGLGRIPFDLSMEEQPLRAIPDLRLEAKFTAEENSRIFAGRKTHPFFTSWKGVQTSHVLTNSGTKASSSQKKELGVAFHPIHVLQSSEDDHATLDWGNWIFTETHAIRDPDCECSGAYKGSANSLFDNSLNGSYDPLPSVSFAEDRVVSGAQQIDLNLPPEDTGEMFAASTEFLQDNELGTVDLDDEVYCHRTLEFELEDKLLQERVMSHYHTSHNDSANSLWTDKYRPQNAKQICGNGESVKILSEWLHQWHKKDSIASRVCMDKGDVGMHDVDRDYRQSDSDTENSEESLKNVLLVTGPVGSGKSAAIYASARDQGFQIIEINASDWRNGPRIKQHFGEAMKSHLLQRIAESKSNLHNAFPSKSRKVVNAASCCSNNEVTEVTPSNTEDCEDASSWLMTSVGGENSLASLQGETKTMILFEDVDVCLPEDHGLISTIQHLAETAKRPIILTSNSDNPALPKNLDRSQIRFTVPSMEELLGLINVVCAAEKAHVHPSLVENFVQYCLGDIRKTILLLQFWWQGLKLERGKELHSTCSPVLFDIDAGHHILPRVIPGGYTSQLSDLVAEEVIKSLNMMKDINNFADTKKDDSPEKSNIVNLEPDSVWVKKEAMLGLHSPDGVEYARFHADSDLSDFSSSPVGFARQNSKRNFNQVLSSDSEDEGLCCRNAKIPDMKNIASHCFLTEVHHIPIEGIPHSGVEKLEEHSFQLPGRMDSDHIEECRSLDMLLVSTLSIVPETEMVQETKLFSTTVSYCPCINAAETSLASQDQNSLPLLEPTVGILSMCSHMLCNKHETLANSCGTGTSAVYEEEVGDSLSKSEADVPRVYQPLDECSRVDFLRRCKSLGNHETNHTIDFLKETWKRLHDQRNDLKKHVTAEERTACQLLKHTHGLSNLISDADLLLKDCQTVVSDSFLSSMIPEKTHHYSYSDDQLEMSSVLAHLGICYYAKEIASTGSAHPLDLASEMLPYSRNSVVFGKLASLDQKKFETPSWKTIQSSNLSTSIKSDQHLCHVLQTVVPSRSYQAAKGSSFHEYISTLSQISRFEASRLSACIGHQKQRRSRVPRHYLSSGSFTMSSEQISLLDQYNFFKKTPSLTGYVKEKEQVEQGMLVMGHFRIHGRGCPVLDSMLTLILQLHAVNDNADASTIWALLRVLARFCNSMLLMIMLKKRQPLHARFQDLATTSQRQNLQQICIQTQSHKSWIIVDL